MRDDRGLLPALFAALFGLCVLLSFMGCTTNGNPLADVPLESDTKVYRYIEAYGDAFTVTRRVESGTVLDEYTWPARGIRILAAMETGDIIRKESFAAGGRAAW